MRFSQVSSTTNSALLAMSLEKPQNRLQRDISYASKYHPDAKIIRAVLDMAQIVQAAIVALEAHEEIPAYLEELAETIGAYFDNSPHT